jgi:hypothetical protein
LTGDELSTLEGIGVTTTTRDLVRLHRRVVSLLSPRWYDERDLLDTAVSASGPPVALPAGHVLLYLPQDLTAPEVGFARALAAARDLTVVQGVTFSERGDRAVLGTVAALVEEPPAIPTGGTGASDHPDLWPTADRVMHASDADDEVRRVVRDVVQALGTVPAERLAVLYSARDPYARLLHEQLVAAGVRVYGPGSRPVAERAVARTVLELLDLHAADVPRSDLFRVLAGAPVRDADGTRVPVTAWERVSREARGWVRGTGTPPSGPRTRTSRVAPRLGFLPTAATVLPAEHPSAASRSKPGSPRYDQPRLFVMRQLITQLNAASPGEFVCPSYRASPSAPVSITSPSGSIRSSPSGLPRT